jgi:hypothetical protein
MRISALLMTGAVAAVAVAGSAMATVWTPDRYEPQVFTTNGNDITLGLRSAGFQANRVAPFDGGFYNYQGMATSTGFDSAFVGSSVSIEMYVSNDWNDGVRAGFWTTMSNGNNSFPIIEYTRGTSTAGTVGSGNFTGFRWWQSGIGWTEINQSFTTNAWYRLTIGLSASQVSFGIADVATNATLFSTTASGLGADKINNVILNAHNQGIAGEYDVLYRNFAVNAIPAPGALALLGAAGLFGARRRR